MENIEFDFSLVFEFEDNNKNTGVVVPVYQKRWWYCR